MKYAHPEVMVDTQWVEDHIKDTNVRIAEVDYDPKANYFLGHVPNAVLFDWKQDINDPLARNIIGREACEELIQRAGVNNETTLILMETLTIGLQHLHSGCLSTMVSRISD
jgi:thiosulfate/3-mercaptopyruvate sulfurtransferase